MARRIAAVPDAGGCRTADETGERVAQEEDDLLARRDVVEAHIVAVQHEPPRGRRRLQRVFDCGSAGLADMQKVQRSFEERRDDVTIMPHIPLGCPVKGSSR